MKRVSLNILDLQKINHVKNRMENVLMNMLDYVKDKLNYNMVLYS